MQEFYDIMPTLRFPFYRGGHSIGLGKVLSGGHSNETSDMAVQILGTHDRRADGVCDRRT